MTQSAGKDNVRSAGFSTNNHLIDVEDVANKGATSENSNVLNNDWSINDINREGGSDTNNPALTKTLGTCGEQQKLDTIAKSVERLSRHV